MYMYDCIYVLSGEQYNSSSPKPEILLMQYWKTARGYTVIRDNTNALDAALSTTHPVDFCICLILITYPGTGAYDPGHLKPIYGHHIYVPSCLFHQAYSRPPCTAMLFDSRVGQVIKKIP